MTLDERRLGDKGQRYEVWCTDGNGFPMCIGWTDEPNGGGLVCGVQLHPGWHSPYVIDRKKNDDNV